MLLLLDGADRKIWLLAALNHCWAQLLTWQEVMSPLCLASQGSLGRVLLQVLCGGVSCPYRSLGALQVVHRLVEAVLKTCRSQEVFLYQPADVPWFARIAPCSTRLSTRSTRGHEFRSS